MKLTSSVFTLLVSKPENFYQNLKGGNDMIGEESFSEIIYGKRREKNMTQQELADKLHITDKAVSKWERGVSQS